METTTANSNTTTTPIQYSTNREYTVPQIQELFSSVGWDSARFPDRVFKALQGSSTVVTAWDGDHLIGLARAIDDGEMLAYIHWVLVNPAYHSQHVGSGLITHMKDRYKDYAFLEVMPEQSKNVPFYEKQGFTLMTDGRALQIVNFPDSNPTN